MCPETTARTGETSNISCTKLNMFPETGFRKPVLCVTAPPAEPALTPPPLHLSYYVTSWRLAEQTSTFKVHSTAVQ